MAANALARLWPYTRHSVDPTLSAIFHFSRCLPQARAPERYAHAIIPNCQFFFWIPFSSLFRSTSVCELWLSDLAFIPVARRLWVLPLFPRFPRFATEGLRCASVPPATCGRTIQGFEIYRAGHLGNLAHGARGSFSTAGWLKKSPRIFHFDFSAENFSRVDASMYWVRGFRVQIGR